MKSRYIITTIVFLWNISGGVALYGAIYQLDSPDDITTPTTIIDFEGYADETVANTLFQAQGISLTRDDGEEVFIRNWTALGRTTTSPDNTIGTFWLPPVNPGYVTHLNLLSTTPIFSIGAYFGNDQTLVEFPVSDFSMMRLSVYDSSDTLLGFVDLAANQNTSVDQFIGLRSDVPFSRVRFENLNDLGEPSGYYSVALDDLVFTNVPEPSTLVLIALGAGTLYPSLRIRRTFWKT